MDWWIWMLLGFVLLAGEMATPGGFYLLFFGVGAVVVGLAALAGLVLPIWGQWLLFSALSVALLALVRPRIVGRFHQAGVAVDDSVVGEWVRVETRTEPGDLGRGELRGSPWTISNAGAVVARAGRPLSGAARRGPHPPREERGMKGWTAPERSSSRSPSPRSRSWSSRRRRSSCRSRAPTWSSSSASTAARSQAGFHILVPFVERDRLPAHAEGAGDRHPRADLHHARTTCRSASTACCTCRCSTRERASYGITNYDVRDHAARADHAAQRDRQDRPRPHLRGARHDQRPGRDRARQGLRALGREGAALRDQEHQAAAGRARGDGEADARRAREARRDPHLARASATPRSTRPRARSSA